MSGDRPAADGAPARTLRVLVEYDGTDYFGWQRQDGVPTIQQHVEEALEAVLCHRVVIEGSGRTDRGVHAVAHPASFVTHSRLPVKAMLLGANSELPDGIVLTAVEEMPAGFHARHDARSKVYRYTIFNRRLRSPRRHRTAAFEPRPMVVAWMREGARHFVGTHDFFSVATHAKLKESTVRTVFRCDVARRSADEPDLIDITIEGDGFLYNQVRTMAGTLLEVGTGKRPPSSIADLLAVQDRKPAGPNLPPRGLTLMHVTY